MSAWILVRNDMRLQLRYGLYAAYGFVAAVYIVLLWALPPGIRTRALPPLLLSEASVIGLFFSGTLLHLERGDGVLHAFAVTPLRPAEYIVSRAVSLAVLTAAAMLAIAWGGAGGAFNPLVVAGTAALTAMLFVALGIAAASRFASLDRFMLWGGLGSAVLGLPVLPSLGVAESPLWAVFPTYPPLYLLGQAFGAAAPGAPAAAVFAVAALLGWCGLASLLAHRWLVRYAMGRGGGA